MRCSHEVAFLKCSCRSDLSGFSPFVCLRLFQRNRSKAPFRKCGEPSAFPPISGAKADIPEPPLGASNGLMRPSGGRCSLLQTLLRRIRKGYSELPAQKTEESMKRRAFLILVTMVSAISTSAWAQAVAPTAVPAGSAARSAAFIPDSQLDRTYH